LLYYKARKHQAESNTLAYCTKAYATLQKVLYNFDQKFQIICRSRPRARAGLRYLLDLPMCGWRWQADREWSGFNQVSI